MQRLSVSIPRGCGKEGENPLAVLSPAFMLERIRTSSSGTRRMHCQIKPGRPRINVLFTNGHGKRTVCDSDIWQESKWTGTFPREALCLLWCRGISSIHSSQPQCEVVHVCTTYSLKVCPLACFLYFSHGANC